MMSELIKELHSKAIQLRKELKVDIQATLNHLPQNSITELFASLWSDAFKYADFRENIPSSLMEKVELFHEISATIVSLTKYL